MNRHFPQINSRFFRSVALPAKFLAVLFVVFIGVAYSATDAGTVIKNQASASYRDSFGIKRIATSNVVETLIRQVAAIEITQNQSRPAIAGQQLYFTHIVTNAGNGLDRYLLNAFDIAGGGFIFDTIAIYTDDNRDGQPDSFNPITITKQLAPGESQSVVVAVAAPAGSIAGSTSSLGVSAVSEFDGSVSAQNTDTATVTEQAVVEVSKSINVLQGNSPGGPFTVSILYHNNSSQQAVDFAVIDALPAGMSYVPGSGTWSGTGAAVLSDTNPNDVHTGSGGTITYCAYDAGCINLVEANADADTTSSNQVTAVIGSVNPGDSGQIQFQVTIDSGLASSVLLNYAEIDYSDGNGQSFRTNSNTVPFRVVHGSLVVINGSVANSADGTNEPLEIANSVSADLQAGNSVFFRNVVWNNGNGTDIFDITTTGSSFPTGTVFRLLQVDGQTPLLDTSGNGIVDTGPIDSGESYEIVLQVVLPDGTSGDNGGANFEVSAVATSVSDTDVSNAILNRLISIAAGEVDITNTAPVGDAQATGVGLGPEASAVSTVNIAPGSTGTMDLYINNTSQYPMDFDLSASIHSDFSTIELPENWTVEFQLDSGDVIANTGIILPGEFLKVSVVARVPSGAAPTDISLYFRALNDRYVASDIKHDQFSVLSEPSFLLGINQEGQVSPGGSHVYTHSLLNSGNVDVNNISLSTTNDLAAEGWTSLIYEDTDGDGVFSGSDQIVDTVSLTSGQSIVLFVKVFAPATAINTQFNSTVLTATDGITTHSVTDISNVSTAEISVLKEQSLDNGCDGVLDTPYSAGVFAVEPGNNCVSYRLTATNGGSASILNVVVADATPTFTSYIGSAVCSKPACSINEPAAGSEGEIIAALPELVAGDSVVVEFMVRID